MFFCCILGPWAMAIHWRAVKNSLRGTAWMLSFSSVFIFMLSFFLENILCYHFWYHLKLSFIIIISPLFSFSWKRDTLGNKHNLIFETCSSYVKGYASYLLLLKKNSLILFFYKNIFCISKSILFQSYINNKGSY